MCPLPNAIVIPSSRDMSRIFSPRQVLVLPPSPRHPPEAVLFPKLFFVVSFNSNG